MDGALKFYRDVLGLECTYESQHWSSLQVEDMQIGLHGPGSGEGSVPATGWIVSFLTDDLVGLRKALLDAGVDVENDLHDTPRGTVLTFCDPEGNPLQAMQLGVKGSQLH